MPSFFMRIRLTSMISTSMMTSALGLSQARRSFSARATACGVSRTVTELRFLSTWMAGTLYIVLIIWVRRIWTSLASMLDR